MDERRTKALIATRLNGDILLKKNGDDERIFKAVICSRCWGSGRHGPTAVYGGICFLCDGNKYTGAKEIKNPDRVLKNAIKRKVKKAIEAKEAREAWIADTANRNRDAFAKAILKIRLEAGKEEGRLRKAAVSEYVGEVGERLKGLKLEVIFKKELPGYTYNSVSLLIIFKDAEGNKFKAFYSGGDETLYGLPPTVWDEKFGYDRPLPGTGNLGNYCVKLTGTVKKHETYRDEKSTVLTRIKVEDPT